MTVYTFVVRADMNVLGDRLSHVSAGTKRGIYVSDNTKSLAIAERRRCREGKIRPEVHELDWETIFCGHYRYVFNHCDVIGLQSYRIR